MKNSIIFVVFSCLGAGCVQPETPVVAGSTKDVIITESPCFVAHKKALSDIHAIAVSHRMGCSVDADCMLVEASVSCQSTCRRSVLVTERAAFEARLKQYEQEHCPALPTNCMISGLCGEMSGAKCVSGVCRIALVGTTLLPSPLPNSIPANGDPDGG